MISIETSLEKLQPTDYSRLRIDKFEHIRQTLANMSLVPGTVRTRHCGEKWTDSWTCNACVNTHFCTVKVSGSSLWPSLTILWTESSDRRDQADHEV